MGNKILYFIFLSFAKLIILFPNKARWYFFLSISRIAYYTSKRVRKRIQANLDFVFADKMSKKEKKDISKFSFFNMALWAKTIFDCRLLNIKNIDKFVETQNLSAFEKHIKEKRKIIFISGHFGNIEMLGCYMSLKIAKIVHIYRKSNFSLFDDYIVASRESLGATMVEKTGALKKLARALKHDMPVSMIMDQSVRPEVGILVDFLGKKTYQTSSVAFLAQKFDAVIVPLAFFTEGVNKYKVKFYEPILPFSFEDKRENLRLSAQAQADAISKMVYEDPKQWFWPHKRFKTLNKEIYE